MPPAAVPPRSPEPSAASVPPAAAVRAAVVSRRAALRAAAAAVSLAGAAACDTAGRRPTATASLGTRTASPALPPPSPGSRRLPTFPAEIVNGPRDRPKVALTFHGQGDPTEVRQLLDELASASVQVTVLAVGSWLAAEPDLATRILDGGHELGNHTQNHIAIARLDPAAAFAEIDACGQQLKKLTGSIGVWFRPSQIQHATPVIEAQAARAGYPSCLSYDVDSLDYTDPGAAAVVRNTLATVDNGSIVSLHFGHQGTVAAIAGIADGLRQRGLAPVTMTGLMT